MPHCPKCGTEVREEMVFCPNCGSPLKVEQPSTETTLSRPSYRAEKMEKHEKAEKGEKQEKEEKQEKTAEYEKLEFGVIGPSIAGLILIFLGLVFYLQITGLLGREAALALFLILIGSIIIVVAVYASVTAGRRHPRT